MIRARPLGRFFTAMLVAMSLLFSQLALASYVCPGQPDVAAMAETMADGEPCTGMDEAQPVLCHQYASGAAQTFEAIKLVTPTQPALVQVLILPAVPEAEVAALAPITASPEPRPPPDPLFLSTLRLRV